MTRLRHWEERGSLETEDQEEEEELDSVNSEVPSHVETRGLASAGRKLRQAFLLYQLYFFNCSFQAKALNRILIPTPWRHFFGQSHWFNEDINISCGNRSQLTALSTLASMKKFCPVSSLLHCVFYCFSGSFASSCGEINKSKRFFLDSPGAF